MLKRTLVVRDQADDAPCADIDTPGFPQDINQLLDAHPLANSRFLLLLGTTNQPSNMVRHIVAKPESYANLPVLVAGFIGFRV